MEKVLCAAIHWDDGKIHSGQPKNIEKGFIIAGRRHHNCFATYSAIRETNDKKHFQIGEEEQGFLTDKDRFVSRVEGLSIAKAADQILPSKEIRNNQLYSEDLY